MNPKTIDLIRSNDHLTLSRVISQVESNSNLNNDFFKDIYSLSNDSIRIGITGPPGAGKSTLTNQMIKLFLKDQTSTNWRRKNKNVCDSPNLYFALLPNGEFAPCCDFRHSNSVLAQDSTFPLIYKDKLWRKEVEEITTHTEGMHIDKTIRRHTGLRRQRSASTQPRN